MKPNTLLVQVSKKILRDIANIFFLQHYSSPAKCQDAVEKAVSGLSPDYLSVGYSQEFDRRATLLRFSLFYLPISAILMAALHVMIGSAGPYSYKGLLLNLSTIAYLGFMYRFTFIKYYFDAKKVLAMARRAILISHPKKEPPFNISLETRSILINHLPIGGTHSGDLAFLETGENIKRGALTAILLDQLVRKESKLSNIFKGDIDISSEYYVFLTNCRKKYFLSRAKLYRKRDTMPISTENARSTHLKYLSIILAHYEAMGEPMLVKQAEDLKLYILRK